MRSVQPLLARAAPRLGSGATLLAAALALGAGAGIVLASRRARPARRAVRDYSQRSGFPQGVEAARGAARRGFAAPAAPPADEPARPQLP